MYSLTLSKVTIGMGVPSPNTLKIKIAISSNHFLFTTQAWCVQLQSTLNHIRKKVVFTHLLFINLSSASTITTADFTHILSMEIDRKRKSFSLVWEQLLSEDPSDDDPSPELVIRSDQQIMESIARFRKTLQSLGDKLPDKGQTVKALLWRHERELKRRKKLQSPKATDKECEETIQLSDHRDDGASQGKKKSASKSHYGVAISSSAHVSLTDEKMQRIVNELVNLGIRPSDVGKAAEVCYRDSVKVKVLFALPSDMRRSYVIGFLYPQN